MVTHDPNAAAYASRVVFLSRRAHHRRAPRPDRRRHPREDARAGRLAVWKVTRKGLAAHKVRFVLTALAVHHRRRVHGGHVGADRDHPADVRRPVRATSTAAPTRSSARPRCSTSDFGTGQRPNVPASLVDVVRSARRRSRPPTARSPARTRRSSTRTARRSAATARRPSGSDGSPTRQLNQFHLVDRPAAAHGRRDRDRPPHRRRGQPPGRRPRDGAHHEAGAQVHGRRHRASSAPPTASPVRRSRCSRCPRRSASRTRWASSARSASSAKNGREPGRGHQATSAPSSNAAAGWPRSTR